MSQCRGEVIKFKHIAALDMKGCSLPNPYSADIFVYKPWRPKKIVLF